MVYFLIWYLSTSFALLLMYFISERPKSFKETVIAFLFFPIVLVHFLLLTLKEKLFEIFRKQK